MLNLNSHIIIKVNKISFRKRNKYYKAQTKIYFSREAFWLSKYQQQRKARLRDQ